MQKSLKTRVSIELVPRDIESLNKELHLVRKIFASVATINIPDLPRFDLRSWDGCVIAKALFRHAIPHIRAMDIHPDQPLVMAKVLQDQGIDELLVITGDSIPDTPPSNKEADAVLQVIRRFKQEIPGIRVYAAIDPYRWGFRQEYDYIQQKLEAGADGFFTQPFFDVRLMEIYAELLVDTLVFWGVSPVTTDKSRAYWEKRNKALFPRTFTPTLDWNRTFARQALNFAQTSETHLYFMPIRTDLTQYLQGILF